MANNVETNEAGLELDLSRLFKALKKNFWLILLAGVIVASIAFLYVSLFVAPSYSSEVVLYVNSMSVMINDKTYGSLTPDKVKAILRELREEAQKA